jgi:hypothetical protein
MLIPIMTSTIHFQRRSTGSNAWNRTMNEVSALALQTVRRSYRWNATRALPFRIAEGQPRRTSMVSKSSKARLLTSKKPSRPKHLSTAQANLNLTTDSVEPINADMRDISLTRRAGGYWANDDPGFIDTLVPPPVSGVANWGIPAASTSSASPELQVSLTVP